MEPGRICECIQPGEALMLVLQVDAMIAGVIIVAFLLLRERKKHVSDEGGGGQ